MLRIVWLVVTLACVALVACFAVANRGTVAVDLWPFPIVHTVPLFALILLTFFAGVFLGGIASWLASWGRRTQAERYRRRAVALEARERLRREEAAAADAARRRDRRAQLAGTGAVPAT